MIITTMTHYEYNNKTTTITTTTECERKEKKFYERLISHL